MLWLLLPILARSVSDVALGPLKEKWYYGGMRSQGELKKLLPGIQEMLRAHDIELAYIFGSTASREERQGSDIDLAVLLPRSVSTRKRFSIRLALQAKLTQKYKKEFDVIVLNDIGSLLFKYVIISEGVLVYRRDEVVHTEFECRVLSEYADFRPFLDQYEAHYVSKNT